jgi:hypothetical protein
VILDRCPWYIAGPLVGLLIVALRATLNKPFGALGGYIDLAENGARLGRLSVRAYVLFGIVIGGAAFALARGSYEAALAYGGAGGPLPPGVPGLAVALGAGVLMGFGARTAGGCTSGHGLSGLSLGSKASLTATMAFFGMAMGVAHLLDGLGGTP